MLETYDRWVEARRHVSRETLARITDNPTTRPRRGRLISLKPLLGSAFSHHPSGRDHGPRSCYKAWWRAW